jgi:hypothetical protein
MESGVVGGGMASEDGGLATSWRLAAGMASGRGREPGGGDLGAGRGRCRSPERRIRRDGLMCGCAA